MKGIEFAMLRTGVGAVNLDCEYAPYYYCVLVKHPDAGYFMYDVGVGPGDDTFRRPENHIQQCPLAITRDEYVDKRLSQMGVDIKDISGIIISHCHWDHFGGLCFFKDTPAIKNVYVYEEDFKRGLMQSHRTAKGYVEPCDFYYRWNFDLDGVEYHMINGDTEIFPGVELKIFKGHSAGVLAMILHMENDTYIFPGDTVPREENYLDPVSTIHFTTNDVDAFRNSVREIKELQEKYNAKMMFSHDDRAVRGFAPKFIT